MPCLASIIERGKAIKDITITSHVSAYFKMKGCKELKHIWIFRSWWRVILSLLALALIAGLCLLRFSDVSTKAAGVPAHRGVVAINFQGQSYSFVQGAVQPPPTDKQCRKSLGIPCYNPFELRRAYNVDGLLSMGDDGSGQTIIIIDSFGSPTIESDLHAFDKAFGLPDPPSFKIYTPLGTKPFNPNNGNMIGWAAETTLDVEWAHAMAPGANIALMTSPVNETQGVQGMPQFLFLEQYALDKNIGKIISQSWATTENTLFYNGGRQVLTSFNDFYRQAAADHVTVFASSGDSGVANPNIHGQTYPFPTVNFPASSPYVTAVGGTNLYATTEGRYQAETAWDGSGGGVSQYFAEPDYQVKNLNRSQQAILNGYRGLPDIAYNASGETPILVYLSFIPGQPGWYLIAGTSEGSPQWAGIIADGNQYAGHPLGFINPALYALGHGDNRSEDYHDVTIGNNSVGGIPGYNAAPGWDPVTGWGSPNATNLIEDIVQAQG
jgi:subtilase family serine protease